jgi:hypothetical protein
LGASTVRVFDIEKIIWKEDGTMNIDIECKKVSGKGTGIRL